MPEPDSTTPTHPSCDDKFARDQEAVDIYRVLFKREIPGTIKARFLEASRQVDATRSAAEVAAYYAALARINDLEALEVASRYTGKLPLLPLKFRLMVFLAETIPENHDLFVNERPAMLQAFLSLGLGLLRTIYKFAKGYLLLSKVSHA